jgi:hypothetical protein
MRKKESNQTSRAVSKDWSLRSSLRTELLIYPSTVGKDRLRGSVTVALPLSKFLIPDLTASYISCGAHSVDKHLDRRFGLGDCWIYHICVKSNLMFHKVCDVHYIPFVCEPSFRPGNALYPSRDIYR